MSAFEARLRAGIENAVRVYWRTRSKQDAKQGKATGSRDAGNRAAVTAGKQLDGFIQLARSLVVECGVRAKGFRDRIAAARSVLTVASQMQDHELDTTIRDTSLAEPSKLGPLSDAIKEVGGEPRRVSTENINEAPYHRDQ